MTKIKTLIKSSPGVIAFIYIVIGFLWIQFSDQWVLAVIDDPETITRVQSLKGFFFIIASGLLIYLLVKKSNTIFGELINNLEATNKKFHSTIEYAPVGFAFNKPNEKWIEVNQTLCDILGYNREELMQINFSDFIHHEDLNEGRELDQKLTDGNINTIEMEKRYIRKNGSQFHGLVRKSAVRDKDGSALYLITVLQDITKQKEYETSIKRSLEEKEVLLSEVHHRVKNNLALISALFDLQNIYTDNSQVKSILDKSNLRIKCLSMIHEDFSYSGNTAEIDFGKCLNELVNFLSLELSPNNEKITVNKSILSIRLNINLAIPVSLIFTELMLNSNHQKPDEKITPDLAISLYEEEGLITLNLSFSDPEKKLKETDDRGSLTCMIINKLVRQIEGELDITSQNDGLSYQLTFTKNDVRGGGSAIAENELQQKQ